jgi:hypothetical protein
MIEARRCSAIAAISIIHVDVVRLRERSPDLKIRVIAGGHDLPPGVLIAEAAYERDGRGGRPRRLSAARPRPDRRRSRRPRRSGD